VLTPARDGFVLVEHDRLLHGTAAPGSPLRAVTPPGLRLGPRAGEIAIAVGDPTTGGLAVIVRHYWNGPHDLVILGPDFEVTDQVAIAVTGAVQWIGWFGPGRLVTGPRSRRPLADSRRSDLATVADLAGRFGRRAATPGALGLLRACLEYRFGADVALGTGTGGSQREGRYRHYRNPRRAGIT
jgi:hypothetical protein